MGMILETGSQILGLEERRESFNIMDLKRTYPGESGNKTKEIKSEHIFAYADGEIEVSKKFLRELIEYFDTPENRERLR